MQKEKKAADELQKKTEDSLKAEEEKVSNLNKAKAKLEQSIDEVCLIYLIYQL